ncbi:MAG: ABC transporter permease [Oscillospiraceae bacterium]|nr:ABC transporter permease [Oscillospiraceae bacterium]
MIEFFTILCANAFRMGTPLVLGAVGEVYSERTGVMMTAIEGVFLAGAFGGLVGAFLTQSLAMGFLIAILSGVIVASAHGWICVYLKQNQVVTGTAIAILVAGLCAFLFRVIFGVPLMPITVTPLRELPIPLLSSIPFFGRVLFSQNLLTYFMFVFVPLAYFVLYRTSLGLVIRSAGENPEAVEVAGIKVNRVRFFTVLFAGGVSGLAGAFYSIGFLGMYTDTIIGGRGWIAFAICFLGNWNPKGAFIGGIVFGFAEAFAISMQVGAGSAIFPNELLIALPYILTIVLAITRKAYNVPAKLGVSYGIEK